jgi:hypothetical protein
MESIELWVVGGVIIVFAAWRFLRSRLDSKALAAQAEKSEAMFKTMFPDLQPHLHPKNVVEYVKAHVSRGKKIESPWENPPGFPEARRAVLEDTPKGERTILQDMNGVALAEFLFLWGDKPPTIGIVRVGEGKFRVKQRSGKPAYATYWHPRREFDWRGPGLWTFRSTVADSAIDSSGSTTNWTDSSSGTSTAAAAAAGAGIVAAGGTFDGGGASAAWDGGGKSDSSSSTGY